MKTRLFLCFFFLLPLMLCAQNVTDYTVKGFLLDSISKEPVPYATIHIARKDNPGKPVKMLVTDVKGKFKEQLPSAGDYSITISSVGNRTVVRDFSTEKGMKTIDLGALFTSESVEELGNVTVVAQKPLVKAEVDKITYDVESDPDSETKTVLDMLRKVPLVTVDGDDNIKLNGKSNFKIHLNGRPSNMLSNNPGKTLKSMPATSVKNIAVITNPGSKYDAEGVGGIIDIITVGGKGLEGYTVTLNAGGNTIGGVNGGVNAIFKIGKVSVSGNYNYYYYRSNIPALSSRTEYFNDDRNHFLNSNATMKPRQPMHFGSVEASYEIDTLNLLTFTFGTFNGRSKQQMNTYTEMLDKDGQMQYAYDLFNENNNTYGGTDVSANYQRMLGKKEELLTVSYRYSHSPSGGDSYQHFSNMINADYSDIRTDNDAATDEHTVQVDYVNPFTPMHTLEAGAKYIYRNNFSNILYEQFDKQTKAWIPVAQNLSDFDHHQHILAAYGAYTLKYKKFGLKAGARIEHSMLQAELHSDTQPDFDADFTDVVPTANLSYQLSDTKTIKAGYNLRIARPGIWYLNPYRDERDPHSISYGNTHLKTEKFHNTEVSFSSFARTLMLNATLYYSFSNNSIQRYSFLNEQNKNVMESTYGNIGKQRSAGLNLYANVNIGSKTNIWLNGSVDYTDLRSKKLDEKASGWNEGFSIGFQQRLPWNLQLGGYGGYYGPDVQLQGKSMSYYYYGLYLNRSFLKDDRLTVSLSGTNFFNKYITYDYSTFTKTFRLDNSQKTEQRSFRINVSYRFGDLKSAVKKVARGIVNDDVKGGGEGNQGKQAQ